MKHLFLILTYVFLSIALLSQNIGIEDAEKIATNVIQERYSSFDNTKSVNYRIADSFTEEYNGTGVFHIINFKPKGFVIISADNSYYPVLGFSFESQFIRDRLNPSVIWWLDDYAKKIEHNIKTTTEIPNSISEEWLRLINIGGKSCFRTNIKTTTPLIKTKWNQGIFYNSHCPPDPAGPGGRVVVGCVAVALGQIMNYFRHPETGTGEYSYYHDDYGSLEVNFAEQHYNYDQMPVKPTDFNDDLSRLLYHIGVSVDMDYGPQGSGMYNHKGAFTLYTYFDYAPETQYLFRDSLPEEFDWNGTLVEHLDQKIPLYYAGWSDTTFTMGHAFIFDAYSDSTHFHVNWGWGGAQDGFFYIENLKPGGNDFTLMHEVIINAVPASIPYTFCSGTKELTAYQGIIDDGSGPINFYENNTECMWLINLPDSANGIKFEFLKFVLDDKDEVIIYDGPDEQSPVLQSFNGADNPGIFQSNSDKVLIKFITDSDSVNEGWLLSYAGIKPEYCKTVTMITEPSGIISDGSNDYMYHNNTTCWWMIQPEDAENFKITFLEFDTEPVNDFLRIVDGNNQIVAILSGSEIPEPILIETDKITAEFRTNSTVRGGGFKFHYEINVSNIEQSFTDKIEIFPNPTSGIININTNHIKDKTLVKVYDAIGKLVLSQEFNSTNKSVYQVDLSRLDSGIYFICLENSEFIYRDKIIKK